MSGHSSPTCCRSLFENLLQIECAAVSDATIFA